MNAKQNELLQTAYELDQHANILASTSESMKQKDQTALEDLKNRYSHEATRMETYYQRAVGAYQRLYGMPNLTGTLLTLQDAGKLAYDVKFITLLTTAPTQSMFSKKAKVEQYNQFCRATLMMCAHYRQQAEAAAAYLKSWYGGGWVQAEDDFIARAAAAKSNASLDPAGWSLYPVPFGQRSGNIYLGDIELPLDAAGAAPSLRNAGLVDSVDGEPWLRIPFACDPDDTFALFATFQGKKDETMYQQSIWLRGVVYQLLRASAPYSIQITYLDPSMGGASLRELNQTLSSVIDGNAFRLREEIYHNSYRLLTVGTTRDECTACLKTLESLTGAINKYCGGRTLRAYNAERIDAEGQPADCENGGVIPKQIVIYENAHGRLDDNDQNILNRLVKLGHDCGISVIITSCLESGEQIDEHEQKLLKSGIEVISIGARTGTLMLNDFANEGSSSHLRFNFEPYLVDHCHDDFLNQVIASMHPKLTAETRIEKLIDLSADFGTGCGDIAVQVPIGVNDRGKLIEFRLGDADCAHGIMAGHAGCGKSSLLHTIIYGIALKYRPEDVEIWLSDYKAKGVEFRNYKEGIVPHVRYVGTGNSVEYSYAFLNRVQSEYLRRAQAFAESQVTSLEAFRKKNGPDSMTRLIIIVDEFHVLSDHVKEDPTKKNQLTNLLREMRALGMAFLFSDQTCGVGLGGLSESGKQQLTARLAMQTTYDEYNAVFNISNAKEILPTQDVREILVQRVTQRMDAEGKIENHVYYEHAKTIFTDIPVREQISSMLAARYPNRPKPKFVKDAEREMPSESMYTSVSAGQIFIGSKLDGSGPVHFALRPTFTENVMMLAAEDEILGSLARAVLNAALAEPYAEIYVMAYEYDSLYEFLRPYLNKLNRVYVCSDLSEICHSICILTDEMTARRKMRSSSPIYVLWVGMTDICMEMGYQSSVRPKHTIVHGKESSVSNVQSETDDVLSRLSDLTAFFSSDDNETVLPSNSAACDEPGESDYLYNACDDIQALMQEGPRRSIFHVVCYPGYSAVKMVKRNGMAKPEDFKHKLAVDISNDDAGEFFGSARVNKSINGEALEQNIGVYFDGKNDQKFMPYMYLWERTDE